MANRGRKAKITEDSFLKAVRKTKSLEDRIIAENLKMNRSSVYRFKVNNPKVVEKGRLIISKAKAIKYDPKNITWDLFSNIPVISEWIEMQTNRRVGVKSISARVRTLYNVCMHLKTHPRDLTIDQLSVMVKEARDLHDADKKPLYGLSYLSVRKPIRSFFQLTRGISGELLTSRGIDAGRTKGTGAYSKQKVTKEQRTRFLEFLPDAVDEILEKNKYSHLSTNVIADEIRGLTYFMYYTATRIGATNSKFQGSLSVRTNNDKHGLSKEEWTINLIDKGKRGGIEWNKMLIDDGLEKIRTYACDKFDIRIENVEYELKEIDSFLFPTLNSNYSCEREVMKLALRKAGCITTIPNHIWRHTFAQDFLHATKWNYELCASVGGWKDTNTLKLSYGEMTKEAMKDGLREAMGLPVEKVVYELRF